MQLHDLIRACCALAPEALAEEWDNVGLQAGEPKQPVASVLLCVDLTPDVLAEAERLGVGCVVSHHPLIFRPLRTVREDRVEGHLLSRLVRAGIALYVMHTNLDLACPGTSDALAGALGVVATEPLQRLDRAVGERQVKLAVFVPLANADGVRTAMGDAGAGIIGDYSHCSFSTPGTGSFRPLEGAHPTIGSVGTQEKVSEERVEVLVPAGALPRVVDAMLATHPYQEVAYDLYPLAPPPSRTGLGRIGRPAQPCTLGEFADLVRRHLPASHVLVCGDPARSIEQVALCGGSGADLIDAAAAAGADVLVTGDVKHHQALHARDRGLALIDAGHFATERPVLDTLAAHLRSALPADVAVQISAVNTDPFSF